MDTSGTSDEIRPANPSTTIDQILIEPHIMPFLPFLNVLSLRRELEGTNAEILTWGCDGYNERIKQWSDSCDKQVVSKFYGKNAPSTHTDTDLPNVAPATPMWFSVLPTTASLC